MVDRSWEGLASSTARSDSPSLTECIPIFTWTLAISGFTLDVMPCTQPEVDELALRVSNLNSEASEVAVLLQVRLGREHELAKSADDVQAAAESLLRKLRRFMVAKSEQSQVRQSAG